MKQVFDVPGATFRDRILPQNSAFRVLRIEGRLVINIKEMFTFASHANSFCDIVAYRCVLGRNTFYENLNCFTTSTNRLHRSFVSVKLN